jgi:hypothetical protein
MQKGLLLAAAAVLLSPAAAMAACHVQADACGNNGATQRPSMVLNDQLNLSDTLDVVDVRVGSAELVASTSTAAQNVLTAGSEGTVLGIRSTQGAHGNVSASNTQRSGTATLAVASTAAYGNAVTASNVAAYQTVDLRQTTGEHTTIRGRTLLESTGMVRDAVASTVSAGNAVGLANAGGTFQGFTEQRNNAAVTALNEVKICCAANSVTSTGTAVGNSFQANSVYSTVDQNVVQYNRGPLVQGTSNVYAAGTANNVTSVGTAAGNTASITNQAGFTDGRIYQDNFAFVRGESYVTLNNWGGVAVSSGSGVGNSAIVSNTISDTRVYNTQNNIGSVQGFASLEGSSNAGGVGLVSASAVGNAVTGFACTGCSNSPPWIAGFNQQTNWGAVSSTANVNVGQAGAVIASGSAIGNTASFIAGRNPH